VSAEGTVGSAAGPGKQMMWTNGKVPPQLAGAKIGGVIELVSGNIS